MRSLGLLLFLLGVSLTTAVITHNNVPIHQYNHVDHHAHQMFDTFLKQSLGNIYYR